MREKPPLWQPLLILLLVWAAAVIGYGSTQEPVSRNGGKGWDGAKYHRMYEQASRGERLAEEKPYVYRVATPYLAAALGRAFGLDARTAFHAVNLPATLVTALLLYLIMAAVGVRPAIGVFLAASFLLQWHAPLRQQFYDSFNVDAASQPFTCLVLLLGLILPPGARRIAALTAATFAGVFFRESVLFAAGAVWLAEAVARLRASGLSARLLKDRGLLLHALPLLAGMAGIAATHALVDGTGPYSFLVTVLYYLYHKPPMVVLHAFFNGYGTVLIPALLFAGFAREEIGKRPLLGLYALICLVLGWTAGGDTTRINYWGCMTLLPVIGLVLSRLKLLNVPVGLCLVLMAVSTRMFWILPDYPGAEGWRMPVLTNWGADFPYFDLWSELANPRVLMISLFQYLALLAAAGLWIRMRGRGRYLRDPAPLP